MGYDVFVSYSSKQRKVADALVHALESAHVGCWIAPRDIRAGEQYPEAILRGLKETKLTLFVASSESMSSQWCCNELTTTVSIGHPVVPCRIDACELSDNVKLSLASSHWIDAFPNPEKYFEKIVGDVCALLGRDGERGEGEYPVEDGRIYNSAIGNKFSNGDVAKQIKMLILRPFTHVFDYRGRSNRTEFWLFIACSISVEFVSLVIDVIIDWEDPIVFGVVLFALMFPFVSLCVRRVRDCGLSPWLLALCCIPFVGWMAGLYFGLKPSAK